VAHRRRQSPLLPGAEGRGDDHGNVQVTAAGLVSAERVGAACVDAEDSRAEDCFQPRGQLVEVAVFVAHSP
jgi:hypothetical protein